MLIVDLLVSFCENWPLWNAAKSSTINPAKAERPTSGRLCFFVRDKGFLYIEQRKQKAPVRPKRMDAFIASKEMQVPRKKLVKRPNREKRAKKLKKGVAKRAGVWYYT